MAEKSKSTSKKTRSKTKQVYEPTYWHMTGDSFAAQKVEAAKVEKDPVPENISKINIKLADVQNAHFNMKNEIIETPLLASKYIGKNHCNLFFKCENLQHTGSVKARAVFNALTNLTPSERSKGCTVSGGRNFVEAITYFGHRLSIPINVVVPKQCPIQDKQRFKENFAILKIGGNDANEANLHALSYCSTIGSKYIHGSDREDLIVGYGTLGLELLGQLARIDAIICPVGSGGLVAGLILAVKSLKPNCLVYGVECSSSPVLTRALQEKQPVMLQTAPTIAESLSTVVASKIAFHVICGYMDRMITVDETWISRAMIALLEREKLIVEGAGACGVAAVMADKVPELKDKNVVCIISGGNVNSSRISRLIDRGLAAEGRLVKISVTLPDVPGALAKLLAKMYEVGVDIKSLVPEKTWMKRDIYTSSVNMAVETCNAEQTKELHKKLKEDYPQMHFVML